MALTNLNYSSESTISPVENKISEQGGAYTGVSSEAEKDSTKILIAYFTMPEEVNTTAVDTVAGLIVMVNEWRRNHGNFVISGSKTTST